MERAQQNEERKPKIQDMSFKRGEWKEASWETQAGSFALDTKDHQSRLGEGSRFVPKDELIQFLLGQHFLRRDLYNLELNRL